MAKKNMKKKAPKKGKKKAMKKKPSKKVAKKKPKAVKPAKVKKVQVFTRVNPKGDYLTKSEFTNNFCAETGLSRKQATTCIVAMGNIGLNELKKGRKFVMPGLARFVVRKKAATKVVTVKTSWY